MGESVKFASLSNVLSQPIDQNIPFDTYNMKVNLKEMVCPFCKISLCSPAEYKRHRRAMHYRKRAPDVLEMQIGELADRGTIKEIIDEREAEYLCIMEDSEDIEWHRLGPTHPRISEFRKQRAKLMEGVNDGPLEIADADLNEFMSSQWEDI